MKILYMFILSIIIFAAWQNGMSQPMPETIGNDDCCKLNFPQIDTSQALTTDTIFCNSWNTTTLEWELHYITINNYDDAGRLNESVVKIFDMQQQTFTPSTKVTYSYYANDSTDTKTSFLWNPGMNGGDWDYVDKMHYEFNNNNLLINTQSWFSAYNSTEWKDLNKEHYYYSEENLKDSVIFEYWNTIQNAWYYSYRYRYYYDENQTLVDEYSDWANNQTGNFVYNLRISYLPGDAPGQFQEISQYYNSGDWDSASRKLITLNNNQKLQSVLYQNWDPSHEIWDTVVMNREVFDYNPSGLITEMITQNYYIHWVNSMRYGWEYNENENMISSLKQYWNFSEADWRNQQLCIYPVVQTITVINDNISSAQDFTITPNPSTNFIRINTDISHSQGKPLFIYDQNGRLVKTIEDSSLEIWIGDLPAGIYFVHLNAGGENSTEKFIKQ